MSGHHPFEAKNQCALILKIIKGKYDPIPEDIYHKFDQKASDIEITAWHISHSVKHRSALVQPLSRRLSCNVYGYSDVYWYATICTPA
jgi:hypothetical protein